MKTYELAPTDGRKSFYGKATVIYTPDNCKYLKSYNTIVCSIDASGAFRRHWEGYSATTMRHINSFLDFCGLYGGGKSWWDNYPVEPITERRL
jgi:hypothetical protein